MAKVLVVDDEPDIRTWVEITLSMAGHEVLEAAEGGAAIELLERHPDIDLVLLDLRMPGVDGWAVLEWIASNMGPGRPEVIVISAHASAGAAEEARAKGSSAYLSKPFTPEELIDVVDRLAS